MNFSAGNSGSKDGYRYPANKHRKNKLSYLLDSNLSKREGGIVEIVNLLPDNPPIRVAHS